MMALTFWFIFIIFCGEKHVGKACIFKKFIEKTYTTYGVTGVYTHHYTSTCAMSWNWIITLFFHKNDVKKRLKIKNDNIKRVESLG